MKFFFETELNEEQDIFCTTCRISRVLRTADNNSLSRLSRFEPGWLDSPVHLERVSFAGNPFECTCDLEPFVAWFQRNLDRMVRQHLTRCVAAPARTAPPRLAGRPLSEASLHLPPPLSSPTLAINTLQFILSVGFILSPSNLIETEIWKTCRPRKSCVTNFQIISFLVLSK